MEKIINKAIPVLVFTLLFIGLGAAVDYLRHRYVPIEYYVEIDSIVGEDMVVGETEQDFTIKRTVKQDLRVRLLRELNLYSEDGGFICSAEKNFIFQMEDDNTDNFTITYDGDCHPLATGDYYWLFNYSFPELFDRSITIKSDIFQVQEKGA